MIRKMILAMFGAFVVGTASAAQIDFGDVPATQPVLDSADPFGFGYKFTINGTDYYWTNQPSITITAASLGALTAEADPVAGPRLTLIEAQTNNWRQAYAWGNHAAAGYLPATAWQSWLSTNTYVRAEVDQAALAALAAYAATNRVTIWRDTENSNILWTAVSGSELLATLENAVQTNTNYVVVTFSENFRNNFNQPYPDVAVTNTYGSTFNNGYWSFFTPGSETWLITFSHPEEAVYWQSEGLAVPATLTSQIGGSGYAYVNWLTYTTNIVTRYTLTTGNVWQAVADMQQTAADAQLAADQAATLVNYHTTLDAAPHAGKFVTPQQLTNALAASGSILQPIRLSSTNIVIAATNAVYYVALTNAANIGLDFSALALGGTNRADVIVIVDCQSTQALASVFANAVAFDLPWEPTVTGRYEVAVSSDGVRTTARQSWPKVDTAQFGYVKYNYVGTPSTSHDFSVIADGATNGAVYTWVSCPDCRYVVRAQFSGGNEGDTVTFGYYRFVLGYADFISPFVSRTIINPGSPYGFSSGWVIVPSPTPTWLGGPGFANGVGLWVTRSSSTSLIRCTVLEVRKANALEIKAAQAMGL